MRLVLNTPYAKLTDLFLDFGKIIDLTFSDHNEDKIIQLSDELGGGTVWYREVTNGMGLVIVKGFTPMEQMEIVYQHDNNIPAYGLLFFKELGGTVKLFSEKENKETTIEKGAYLISSAMQEMHTFKPGQTTELVSIFIFPEFIEKYLKSLLKSSDSDAETTVVDEFFMQLDSIDSEILLGMNALENNQFTGTLKSIYLESKVLELIALFFRESEQSAPRKKTMNKGDQQKIIEAKELLGQNLESPPTIIQLSRMVGLNEYKLRLGFKELFNNTIYGYLRQIRMKKAKELIEAEELSVSEAGFMVGYSNMSHFANAFKNEFGVTPGQLKR